MSTTIRPELSEKNRYHVRRHKYWELRHFCLQYSDWKKGYHILENCPLRHADTTTERVDKMPENFLEKIALEMADYSERMKLVETTCKEADPELYDCLLEGVTTGKSYENLAAMHDMPCSRDTYYDRYRKFFYLLSKKR